MSAWSLPVDPAPSNGGDLHITCADIVPEAYGVTPTLLLRLALSDPGPDRVQSVNLHAQVQIDAARRSYAPREQRRLLDLFGVPERWGHTVRALPWTIASVVVPGFDTASTVDVPLPVTYDFEVTAARYLHALSSGDIPLRVLCSGTVFRQTRHGLQAAPIPWRTEVVCALAVSTWRDLIDRYFPDTAWLRLDRATLDALAELRARRALPTLDATLRALLAEHDLTDPP